MGLHKQLQLPGFESRSYRTHLEVLGVKMDICLTLAFVLGLASPQIVCHGGALLKINLF